MMRINFEYVRNLQYKVRALRAEVQAFKCGDAYRKLKAYYEEELRRERRERQDLKRKLAEAYAETAAMRRNWMQVFEDMEKEQEQEKAVRQEQKETQKQRKRAEKAEAGEQRFHEKWKKTQEELYAVQTQLEERKEQNRKLTAQVNRDFENSSIPSSMQEAACSHTDRGNPGSRRIYEERRLPGNRKDM